MKVTIAALAALATSVVAIPAWGDETTTTTTTKATTTTTKPVVATSTTSVWNEWEHATTTSTTTKKISLTTTTTKPVVATTTTWADWEEPDSWTTTIVTAITTFCPGPTEIVHFGKTWTVSTATTLTITDCPCTVSVPVFTKTSTSCSTVPTPAPVKPTSAAPVSPVTTYSPGWGATSVKPAVATFTGAANALVANVGAGLAGVGAIAAFLL